MFYSHCHRKRKEWQGYLEFQTGGSTITNSRVTNSRQAPTIDREPVLSEGDLEGRLMSWKYVDM